MIKGFFPKQHFIKRGSKIEIAGFTFSAGRGFANNHPEICDQNEETTYHEEMLRTGFIYNAEYDFYYNETGAFMSDTREKIEELVKNYPEYKECADLGYEMTYGKPTSLMQQEGYNGIYCTNYETIIDRLKEQDNSKKR